MHLKSPDAARVKAQQARAHTKVVTDEHTNTHFMKIHLRSSFFFCERHHVCIIQALEEYTVYRHCLTLLNFKSNGLKEGRRSQMGK